MLDVFTQGGMYMLMLALPFLLYCFLLTWTAAKLMNVDGQSPGKALKVALFQTVLPVPVGVLILSWLWSKITPAMSSNPDDSSHIALVSGLVLYLLFVWIVSAFIIHGVYLSGLFNSTILSLILVGAHAIIAYFVYGDGAADAPLFQAMQYLELDLPTSVTGIETPPSK